MLFDTQGRVAVIGHRGAPREAPENTLASFRRAFELGADAIELDVRLSRDGVPIVMHYATLERTTNGKGPVSALTLAKLRRLDAGSWFDAKFKSERIPTLDEALAIVARQAQPRRVGVRMLIEIKNEPEPCAGIEDAVVAIIRQHRLERRALVISFDHEAVLRVKHHAPTITTGVLYVARPVDAVALARAANANALLPLWAYTSKALVTAAHAAGLAIVAWTVDERPVMERPIAMGVDAITSNRPDLLLGVVRRRK